MTEEITEKRAEFSRLSSSRSIIQQCQSDYDDAERVYNEFMLTYNDKVASYKLSLIHI